MRKCPDHGQWLRPRDVPEPELKEFADDHSHHADDENTLLTIKSPPPRSSQSMCGRSSAPPSQHPNTRHAVSRTSGGPTPVRSTAPHRIGGSYSPDVARTRGRR